MARKGSRKLTNPVEETGSPFVTIHGTLAFDALHEKCPPHRLPDRPLIMVRDLLYLDSEALRPTLQASPPAYKPLMALGEKFVGSKVTAAAALDAVVEHTLASYGQLFAILNINCHASVHKALQHARRPRLPADGGVSSNITSPVAILRPCSTNSEGYVTSDAAAASSRAVPSPHQAQEDGRHGGASWST